MKLGRFGNVAVKKRTQSEISKVLSTSTISFARRKMSTLWELHPTCDPGRAIMEE